MSNLFILTYTPVFKNALLNELIQVDKMIKVVKDITDELILVETSLSKEDFINTCIDKNLVFAKHMMPVDIKIILKENILDQILNAAKEIVILNNQNFSVQCRIKNARDYFDYSAKDFEVHLGKYYESLNNHAIFSKNILLNEDVSIISILIDGLNCYMGFSTSIQNLNFGCDEHRVCSNNKIEISRAENKLKEALNKFNIKLTGVGYALDLGASPGGWTKVLADAGYNVLAVDPGDLNPSLINNPKITHFKNRIEKIDVEYDFDIITNDMNIDPELTVPIMNDLVNKLKPNGLAIVTFKLPGNYQKTITEGIKLLSPLYEVINIKSLFHNRQEVTVLLKRKS